MNNIRRKMAQNGIKLCIKGAKRKIAKRNKYVQKMKLEWHKKSGLNQVLRQCYP